MIISQFFFGECNYIIKILPVPPYAEQAVFGALIIGPKNCQLAQVERLDHVIPSHRLYHGPKQNGSKVNDNRQKFFLGKKNIQMVDGDHYNVSQAHPKTNTNKV